MAVYHVWKYAPKMRLKRLYQAWIVKGLGDILNFNLNLIYDFCPSFTKNVCEIESNMKRDNRKKTIEGGLEW